MQAPVPPSSNGYAPADYAFGLGVVPPAQQQPTNPGGPVMHEMGYVESQGYPYATGVVSPSLPHHHHQQQQQHHASINSTSVPIVSAKEAHESRQVDFLRWLRGGWSMYCENWKYFSGFQLLIFLFDFLLPFLFFVMTEPRGDFHTMHGGEQQQQQHFPEGTAGTLEYRESPWQEAQHLSLVSLMTWPLYLGHFFVGLAVLRAKVYGVGYNSLDDDSSHHDQGIIRGDAASETDEARIRFHDFLSGYYLYFPLFALTFVHGLLLILGFFCLIVPGIYLAVVLAFTEILYIEYHHAYSTFDRYADEPQPFTFWQAFTVSVERVHPHFLRVAAFLLILAVVYYAGALTIFGSLLTVPFTSLCLVVAFEDLFGLRQDKVKEHACIFAC